MLACSRRARFKTNNIFRADKNQSSFNQMQEVMEIPRTLYPSQKVGCVARDGVRMQRYMQNVISLVTAGENAQWHKGTKHGTPVWRNERNFVIGGLALSPFSCVGTKSTTGSFSGPARP